MLTYCVKCRTKRELHNPREITLRNNRQAIQGVCSVCGTRMFRMVKSAEVLEVQKRRTGQEMPSPLTRYAENPIISPREDSWWESFQTFNPGAIHIGDKVHILYRAVGDDGISRLGYAASGTGFDIEERLEYPVYQHQSISPEFTIYSYSSGGSFGGVEDPRLVRVNNEDKIYMTYTACDQGLRVGLTSIRVDDFLSGKWEWSPPRLISPPREIHKNWVIFPEKIKGKYAILHSLSPKISITYLDSLDFRPGDHLVSYHNGGRGIGRESFWDSVIRGVGPPPVRTELGWLLFYHAVDRFEPHKYKAGALLVDIDDPRKVIRCSSSPVLEPEAVYEKSGFKPGIIYLTSAIIKEEKLLLYYGASDSYVCVASCVLKDFLVALMERGRDVFVETEVISNSPRTNQTVSRSRQRISPGRMTRSRKRG